MQFGIPIPIEGKSGPLNAHEIAAYRQGYIPAKSGDFRLIEAGDEAQIINGRLFKRNEDLRHERPVVAGNVTKCRAINPKNPVGNYSDDEKAAFSVKKIDSRPFEPKYVDLG